MSPIRVELPLDPALALMLFATFLQLPLRRGALGGRLPLALLLANFVGVPLLVLGLVALLPADPVLRMAVALVLLSPCIDYVVTFTGMGQGDARGMLAATPLLLLVQMLVVPPFLRAMVPDAAPMAGGALLHSFVVLILIPLGLAWAFQRLAPPSLSEAARFLPVPATALVLFLVVLVTLPKVWPVADQLLPAVGVYLVFAVIAPLLGLAVARAMRLGPEPSRTVAFSAATRNSLVVLPIGIAMSGGAALVPAVIVTQTLVELASELVYVRLLRRVR